MSVFALIAVAMPLLLLFWVSKRYLTSDKFTENTAFSQDIKSTKSSTILDDRIELVSPGSPNEEPTPELLSDVDKKSGSVLSTAVKTTEVLPHKNDQKIESLSLTKDHESQIVSKSLVSHIHSISSNEEDGELSLPTLNKSECSPQSSSKDEAHFLSLITGETKYESPPIIETELISQSNEKTNFSLTCVEKSDIVLPYTENIEVLSPSINKTEFSSETSDITKLLHNSENKTEAISPKLERTDILSSYLPDIVEEESSCLDHETDYLSPPPVPTSSATSNEENIAIKNCSVFVRNIKIPIKE